MEASSVSIREYRRRGRNSNIVERYPTAESDLGRDRLSELPDSLLINEILSLLEMKDAVRTTILSKRWKDLWITVPTLDFGNESCPSFIERALAKWKGTKILNCRMDFWQDHPSSCGVLDSWLLVPIEKQVEDLYLSVGDQMEDYCPPQRLYSCSSLIKLFLGLCDLKIEQIVQWFKLKSLTIDYPVSLSDDAMNRILSGAPLLEELVLLSVNITEDFNIRSTSLKILEIGTTSVFLNARTVVKAMLKIWAPNLLSLEFSGIVYDTCLLDVPSLTSATLCFKDKCGARGEQMYEVDFPPLEMFDKMFRSISHDEKLTLSRLCIQFLLRIKEEYDMITFSNTKFLKFPAGEAKGMLEVLEMFPQLITLEVKLRDEFFLGSKEEYAMIAFSNIKFLKFSAGESKGRMLEVLEMFPQLITLEVNLGAGECHDTFQSEKSEVDVFQPLTSPILHQLKTVEISWYTCDASILPAIEILLRNACLLEKMVLRPKWSCRHRCDRELRLKVKEKVLSMPRSSTTAKIIAIV